MNRLSLEKSPYLLQHKENPVDWFPWCEEAFEKARLENKPIFLSIGYSSCHWCHVMEEESFENLEIAKLLNDHFVSIKVDREERPDIDSLYMLVCQMMTGHGGWPLSVFMTASQQPFFAGTYFPPKSVDSRLGFQDVLERITYLWTHQKKEIHSTVQTIETAILESQKTQSGEVSVDHLIESCLQELDELWDPQYGGFGSAPKFPSAHKILFLLSHLRHSKNKELLEKVSHGLTMMHRGGIFDHLRGGFHRYSTDAKWELPHFEKMLNDQALCARLYLEAYQLTKNKLFKFIAEKTLEFVEWELKSSVGGYFSSLDADSQGEEGAYYVWSYSELKENLSVQELAVLEKLFDIRHDGNFHDEATGSPANKNILYLKAPIRSDQSIYFSMESVWKSFKKGLDTKVPPQLDKKVLSDWNALYLQTLYIAYDVLGDSKYLQRARFSLDFFEKNLMQGRVLYHRYCDGDVLSIPFLDDYAGFISVYLLDYRLTQRPESLEKAVDLCDEVLDSFYDEGSGGYFQSSSHAFENEKLNPILRVRHRTKDFYDGAYPSANSYMIENLIFLWFLTGQSRYRKKVESFLQKSTSAVANSPSSYCYLIHSLYLWKMGCVEIKVCGKWSLEDQAKIESILREFYLPGKIIKNCEADTPSIQICMGMKCGLPLMSLETFKKEISLLYSF